MGVEMPPTRGLQASQALLPSEYGALLEDSGVQARATPLQPHGTTPWHAPPGWQPNGRSRSAEAMPWRMRCSRVCKRLMTIGCRVNMFGLQLKLDLWRLPQVLVVLYVCSLVWSTLGLPIPSG